MLTTRGWAAVAASVVMLGAGRVLGLEDLFLVGVGLLLVVVAAGIYVLVGSVPLVARRALRPPRVHAGAAGRVEVSLHNPSRRRSPVVQVRDPFDGGARWARLLVAPLAPGSASRAAYRVPTERRGIYELGPMEIVVTDPFGLAYRRQVVAPVTELTVYPRIDVIAPPPVVAGSTFSDMVAAPRPLRGSGTEFYALRPYVRGDDIRKVHWPSTAKAGELMLREDEMPRQTRTTILLDTRVRGDAFEVLVSAAASLIVAASRDSAVRLVTTDGGVCTEDLLGELALVMPSNTGSWYTALAAASHEGGAVVVLTTGRAHESELAAVSTIPGAVLVTVGAPGAGLGGVKVVAIKADVPFAVAWRKLVR